MGDAEVEGLAADRLLALMRRVMAEIVPQAERQRRQLQAGMAAAIILHPGIAIVSRLPAHDFLPVVEMRCGRERPASSHSGSTQKRQRLVDAERLRLGAGGRHLDETALGARST